jgi:hypothetical protein
MNDHPLSEALPFPELAARALALAISRPDDARRMLEWLDPVEGVRLFGELSRIARGRVAPRLMSRDLRASLPALVACAAATVAEAAPSLQ